MALLVMRSKVTGAAPPTHQQQGTTLKSGSPDEVPRSVELTTVPTA